MFSSLVESYNHKPFHVCYTFGHGHCSCPCQSTESLRQEIRETKRQLSDPKNDFLALHFVLFKIKILKFRDIQMLMRQGRHLSATPRLMDSEIRDRDRMEIKRIGM